MSTETLPALKTEAGASGLPGLPDTLKAALPKADYAATAGDFWPEQHGGEIKPKAEPKSEAKPEETKETVTEPAIKDLASRWGAKVKAPAEDVKALIPAKTTEAAKPEEKAEVPAWEKMELDQRASPKARENFKALKEVTRAAEQRAATLAKEAADAKAQLEAARKSPAAVDSTEMEKLRKEHKEAMDRLLVIDTKNHPAFQNQYTNPRKAAIAEAQELLKANGKEADLASLIEKPRGELGKAMQELLKELPDMDRLEIGEKVRTAHKLLQEEQNALKSAREVNGAIRENDSKTHIQEFDKVWDRVTNGIGALKGIEEIPKEASAADRAIVEEYNNAIRDLPKAARELATGNVTYESIADASIKAKMFEIQQGHVLPMIQRQIELQQGVIRGLTKELEGYRSRNPNREISSSPNLGNNAPAKVSTYEEVADAVWSGRK